MQDVPMSAKDRGYIGSLGKNAKKAFGRNGIKAKVAKRLENIASRMLGQTQGKQGKELRAKRQDEEVLFYSIEDDYVPESEPWETRFPDYYEKESFD